MPLNSLFFLWTGSCTTLHELKLTQPSKTERNTSLPFPEVTEQALPKYTHPKRRIPMSSRFGLCLIPHVCSGLKLLRSEQHWVPLLKHTQKVLSRPYFWEKRVSVGWIFWFHQAEGIRDRPQCHSLELNLRQSLQKLPEHLSIAAEVTDSREGVVLRKHSLFQMLNTGSLVLVFWVFLWLVNELLTIWTHWKKLL